MTEYTQRRTVGDRLDGVVLRFECGTCDGTGRISEVLEERLVDGIPVTTVSEEVCAACDGKGDRPVIRLGYQLWEVDRHAHVAAFAWMGSDLEEGAQRPLTLEVPIGTWESAGMPTRLEVGVAEVTIPAGRTR